MPTMPCPADTSPLVDWAQWYAELGWPVFPCRGKLPAIAKAAGGNGYLDATTDPFQIATWWRQYHDANIGIPAGPHWWALDVDPRANGDNTLFALERQHGALPHTLLSHSGGGGSHYLWLPPGQPFLAGRIDLGAGLDVQNAGHYIIVPPSTHPDTGKKYLWDVVDGPDDILPQPCPPWLEILITQPQQQAPSQPIPGMPPPVTGGPIVKGLREKTLISLAGAMQRVGATAYAIRAALEAENQRCVPPLDATDLDRMTTSIGRYPPAPAMHPPAAAPGWSMYGTNGQGPATTPASYIWRKALFAKKNGELTQNVFNITKLLQHADHWQRPGNALWWDSVRGTPMLGMLPINDDLLMQIADYLGEVERLPITNLRMLEQCVTAQCHTQPRDLLQTWLNNLPPWDHMPRLNLWLTETAGVEDSAYHNDVSRILPLSMVARAMEPGCLYRFVVILEGPEEAGKSSLVRALASPEWYVELAMGLETKESHMMLQGAWVAEMAELDSLSRTEETRLKAFITLREDSYIPKYSNFRITTPRRTIFVGTTNEESYLKGQTGNTRFLPIKIHGQIALTKFVAMREQLFAEALHVYRADPDHWLQLSDEAMGQAGEERERRRLTNVYEQPLHEWLEYGRFLHPLFDNNQPVTFLKDETSWPEIARWYLGLMTPAEWKDKSLQMQVAQALKVLEWHQETVWRHGRTAKVWQKT